VRAAVWCLLLLLELLMALAFLLLQQLLLLLLLLYLLLLLLLTSWRERLRRSDSVLLEEGGMGRRCEGRSREVLTLCFIRKSLLLLEPCAVRWVVRMRRLDVRAALHRWTSRRRRTIDWETRRSAVRQHPRWSSHHLAPRTWSSCDGSSTSCYPWTAQRDPPQLLVLLLLDLLHLDLLLLLLLLEHSLLRVEVLRCTRGRCAELGAVAVEGERLGCG
jgi:hypothetical protein